MIIAVNTNLVTSPVNVVSITTIVLLIAALVALVACLPLHCQNHSLLLLNF